MNYKDILDKKFEKAAMFGYKVDDVDDFLEEIAEEIKKLTNKNDELEKKLKKMESKLSEYQDEEDSLRAALIGAQKLGDSVIRESRTKADDIIKDAEYKAVRMITEAQQKIDNEKYALTTIKKEVALFKNNLLSMYKQHLELISNLPHDEDDDMSEIIEETEQEQAVQEMPNEEKEQPKAEEVNEPTKAEEKHETAAKEVSEEKEMDKRHTMVFKKRQASRIEEKFGPLKFGSNYNVSEDNAPVKK